MKKIDKKDVLALVLVILVITVVILSIINQNKKNNTDNNISIVTNYNDFYTVDSCLYRTVTYLNTNDMDSLSLVLTDEYKKNNDINNIFNEYSNLPSDSTFASRKMYYEKVNNNITKYYVYGYALPNLFIENSNDYMRGKVDLYFIVYIDSDNLTFSVEPYDGEIFIGGEIDG